METNVDTADDVLGAFVAEELPDPVVWLDSAFKPKWANRAAEQVFGWDRSTLMGELDLLSIIHPDDLNEALESATTVGEKEVGSLLELRIQAADLKWHRTEIRGRATMWQGEPGLLITIRDLSDRYGWDVAGGDAEVLRTVVEASSTPVFICDPDGSVRGVSAALSRLMPLDRGRLVGSGLRNLAVPADRAMIDAAFQPSGERRQKLDVRLADSEGQPHPFRLEISDLRDDPAVHGYVVFAYDVSDLRDVLADLKRTAETDGLTGLANRQALMDELRARLARMTGQVAVLFCDLNGFKSINDLYGHSRGDRLLRDVAKRLVNAVRPTDMVARLGGDEFVVISSARNAAELEALTDRVERAVSGPVSSNSHEPMVTASVGAVLAGDGTASAEEVLAEADSAMYRSKAISRGFEVSEGSVSERRRLTRELTQAFDNGQIETHFQPVVSLADHSIHGFEALVRWRHPSRGLLTPGHFLAICEEAGLEGRLAAATIRGAAELLSLTDASIGVSLNLSPLQLVDPSITAALLDALAATSTDPARLAVEVTERSVLDRLTRDGRRVPEVLADMRDSGIRVAVDDFGTGSASLARLVEMPASILKVDKSFVEGLGEDPISSALVRSVVGLATELGMAVVAEGVETNAQEAALIEMGCSFGQGWLYSRALPLEDAVCLASRVGVQSPF